MKKELKINVKLKDEKSIFAILKFGFKCEQISKLNFISDQIFINSQIFIFGFRLIK